VSKDEAAFAWALAGAVAGFLAARAFTRAPACDAGRPGGPRGLVAAALQQRILAAVPPAVAETGAMKDAARAASNCAARTLDGYDALELAGALAK
jgi:hypothetical protein